MLKAAESRRVQSQREATFTRLRGAAEQVVVDLSSDGDDERYGIPDGAGGAGPFGASGERVGWVPSAGATQRYERANQGEAVVRLGSGNPRTEISRTMQILEQRRVMNPQNMEEAAGRYVRPSLRHPCFD